MAGLRVWSSACGRARARRPWSIIGCGETDAVDRDRSGDRRGGSGGGTGTAVAAAPAVFRVGAASASIDPSVPVYQEGSDLGIAGDRAKAAAQISALGGPSVGAGDIIVQATHTHAGPTLEGIWGPTPEPYLHEVQRPDSGGARRGGVLGTARAPAGGHDQRLTTGHDDDRERQLSGLGRRRPADGAARRRSGDGSDDRDVRQRPRARGACARRQGGDAQRRLLRRGT